jgi:hypothetical protein
VQKSSREKVTGLTSLPTMISPHAACPLIKPGQQQKMKLDEESLTGGTTVALLMRDTVETTS